MLFAWILFLAVAASNAGANRIVGGEPVSIEEFPWVAQVEMRIFTPTWGHTCGANILNAKFLVSAAHCFHGIFYNMERRRIRAGATDTGIGGVVSTLSRVVNHPEYRVSSTHDCDITVLELKETLTFSDKIQPIQIPYQGFELPANLPVVYAGWGSPEFLEDGLPNLHAVEVLSVDHEICQTRYLEAVPPEKVTENMICAGLIDIGGKDACHGDSGGPLYYQKTLVGVVSAAVDCAHPFFPGINTKISAFTNWILETAV